MGTLELRQRYRDRQEDQLDALGLVVNMIVLRNTIYMEAVLEQFRKEGFPVNEEDKALLSPLIHEHVNTQGRHSFVMPEAVVKGELRPLRNPADDPNISGATWRLGGWSTRSFWRQRMANVGVLTKTQKRTFRRQFCPVVTDVLCHGCETSFR